MGVNLLWFWMNIYGFGKIRAKAMKANLKLEHVATTIMAMNAILSICLGAWIKGLKYLTKIPMKIILKI